ncbi:hypothetical protein [Fodinicola acaciae]|uniref:hypothetical protein n=1 Tax=Fodinicola acaciae TaxID=2681555 RepID=UPI0013D77A00|nr:hypothetical protein [Fodinicola acaciae]
MADESVDQRAGVFVGPAAIGVIATGSLLTIALLLPVACCAAAAVAGLSGTSESR